MSLIIDNSTRFFSVVGAAYIPERHFDSHKDGDERRHSQELELRSTILPPTGSTGWWLHDDR
jgi:hypothetical protein